MTPRPLLLAPLLFPLLAVPAPAAEDAPRPNILLIMADDLGFSDLGCYGGEIATPHLDSIAENGVRFTQFYNTGRCWPTRGSLLTGYYAQQIRRDNLPGVPSGGGNRGRRPDWAALLPELLEPAGYRSYHTGKWHIDGMPIEEGFDRSYYLKDQGRFFHPQRHWKDDEPLPPVEEDSGFYATTALADHVIEVLGEHEREHAGRPFFHYLAFAAPHFPLQALPEDIALYEDTYTDGWEAVRARRWRRLQEMGLLDETAVPWLSRVERHLGPPYHFPDHLEILGDVEVNRPVPWRSLTKEQQRFQADKMAIHAAMIHRMDIEIGRVFDRIREMGEWEDTLVIFLSDNGASSEIMVRDDGHDPEAPRGSADSYLCLGPGWSTVSNTPFRRHKTWTHEGGIATPLVVSWPKGLEARDEIRRTPGHVIDMAPTLLELAGADFAEEAPPTPGKNLLPVLTGEGAIEHESLWWFHDGHKAIRMGDWKAVAPQNQPWELYDLSRDRIESNDLAIQKPEKLETLTTEWNRTLDEFVELASRDLPEAALEKAREAEADKRPGRMQRAQNAAQPKTRQVLPNGERFLLEGRPAFVLAPTEEAVPSEGRKPWVFYAPALMDYPDEAESWLHRQLLETGVAVAGIDVGEAYGSPDAFPWFEALYEEMAARGYARKPALLGRSRGGLWVSSWAIARPGRAAGIGGIYPAFDLTTYPGVRRAAPAYDLDEKSLRSELAELNPIEQADVLAEAGIPAYFIHGVEDDVVPLDANSGALERAYRGAGAADRIEVKAVEGQGHNFWEGFFRHRPLVEFLVERARAGAEEE